MGGSRLRPFCCVGLAYFAIAVAAPLALLSIDQGVWNFEGMLWSIAAGTAGAIGALGIILAFNSGGKPVFVMPLVFGFRPVVNTLTSMWLTNQLHKIDPLFAGSLATVIAGAVMVLVFAPKAQHGPAAHPRPTPAPPPPPPPPPPTPPPPTPVSPPVSTASPPSSVSGEPASSAAGSNSVAGSSSVSASSASSFPRITPTRLPCDAEYLTTNGLTLDYDSLSTRADRSHAVGRSRDEFLRYSLAMELRKEGDHEASLSKLDELTRQAKAYVPAFFMAAQQLVELDRIDQARPI